MIFPGCSQSLEQSDLSSLALLEKRQLPAHTIVAVAHQAYKQLREAGGVGRS